MKNVLLGLAILIILLLAFYKYNQPSIEGEWIADAVIDLSADTLAINSAEVGFNFLEDQYTFSSTLNYVESGKYTHSGNALILTKQGTENLNRVEILVLTSNHLELKMKNQDSYLKLILSRSSE